MTAPRLIIRDLTISRGGYPLITDLNAQLEPRADDAIARP